MSFFVSHLNIGLQSVLNNVIKTLTTIIADPGKLLDHTAHLSFLPNL